MRTPHENTPVEDQRDWNMEEALVLGSFGGWSSKASTRPGFNKKQEHETRAKQ
jgi:hypothetical protein